MKTDFLREIFRSRALAFVMCVQSFKALLFDWLHGKSVFVLAMDIGTVLCWLCVLYVTVIHRRRERQAKQKARARAKLEQQGLAETPEEYRRGVTGESAGPEAEESNEICLDCFQDGSKEVPAPFLVSAGPNGEKKHVCYAHAKKQAEENGRKADEDAKNRSNPKAPDDKDAAH